MTLYFPVLEEKKTMQVGTVKVRHQWAENYSSSCSLAMWVHWNTCVCCATEEAINWMHMQSGGVRLQLICLPCHGRQLHVLWITTTGSAYNQLKHPALPDTVMIDLIAVPHFSTTGRKGSNTQIFGWVKYIYIKKTTMWLKAIQLPLLWLFLLLCLSS